MVVEELCEIGEKGHSISVAAVARVVSVVAVAAGVWASGAAGPERSCAAANLRGFDETRDLSFNQLHPPQQSAAPR
jgi:hypothetical protein